ISLAYSPIMKSFGLDTIIVNMIESFRDSLFFPLSALAAMFGGLVLLFRMIRGGYRQNLVGIALMIVVFILGVVVMIDPKKTMELSEDVPARLEQGLVAAVFATGNSDGDEICEATSSESILSESSNDSNFIDPDEEDYKTFEGDEEFNPRNTMSQMMCENWRTFAFTPYVYGQFGTSYSQLYANGFGGSDDGSFNNDNTELVGDATVNMGGGTTVNNWALYQLDAKTTGTTTNKDGSRSPGMID